MPDMAVQTDCLVPTTGLLTPPDTPTDERPQAQTAIDLFEKRPDGTFIRTNMPILPANVKLASLNLHVENLTIMSQKVVVADAPEDVADAQPIKIPAWVDNLENHVYSWLRFTCPFVRPIIKGGCYVRHYVGRLGFGLSLGIFSIRST